MGWRQLLSVLLSLQPLLSWACPSSAHHHEHGEDHRHHNCVHSQLVEPEIERMMNKIKSIPWETHRSVNVRDIASSRKLLAELDELEPFRIKVDYQTKNLRPEQTAYLKEKLVPAMVGVFQRSLNVRRPVRGPLKLPHLCSTVFRQYPEYCLQVTNTCGSAIHNPEYMADWRTCRAPYDSQCTTHTGGEGAEDADFVLYITSDYEESCSPPYNAVASGGFCLLDQDNWYGLPNRPLAGVANLCPNHLSTADEDFGYMLDTVVHEVLHAILMSRALMDNFIDDSGKKRINPVAIKDGKAKIVTPAVQKHIRDMFNCDALDGAKLEDEGGSGTAGSHWESRMFMGEIMVGKSAASSRDVLSNVTLALAEDSGWYLPNYGIGGVLVASHKKGCDYVTSNCLKDSPALKGVFCRDSRPVREQPNICTSDHMEIGYCRNGLELMGGCNVVTRFKNTACTVPDDEEQSYVDLGTRRQVGARCFPIASKTLQRLTRTYQSYIAGEAACFATKCKNGKLYFEIPETTLYKAMEFECPEGQFVDLTKASIGFGDGLVGPCPAAKSICMWHGCANDCNGHGQCMEGKCLCHVGYVGESCVHQACVKNSCAGGYKCNWMLGRCESSDTPTSRAAFLPKAPAQKLARGEQSEGSTQTETHMSDFFETSVHSPDPLTVSGKAVWNGYLAGCAIFGDMNGDRKWNQGEPGSLTSPNGDWSFQASQDVEIVLDPLSRNTCRDIFTGLQPKWSISTPYGSNYVSPLTTLAVAARRTAAVAVASSEVIDNPDAGPTLEDTAEVVSQVDISDRLSNDHGPNGRTQEVDRDPVWVDPSFSSGLMLEPQQIMQIDVVHEVLMNQDQSSERAMVLSVVLANTVTQVSAFVAGTLASMDQTAIIILRIIGNHLSQHSFDALSLTNAEEVLKILQEAQDSTDPALVAQQGVVSNTVARINQAAFDAGEHLHHLALIEHLTRLSQVAQGRYSRLAALLAQKKVGNDEYATKTGLEASELEGVDVIQIQRVMGIETTPEDSRQKLISLLDFEHSGISLFVAVLLVLSLLIGTCWCCLSHDAPSARSASPETGQVIVNPMVGGVHSNNF